MTTEIHVLDAPVGTGKTSAIFKWMQDNSNRNFLYVSPMLSEVEERVPMHLADLEFTYPKMEYDEKKKNPSKSKSLLRLLNEERNVAFSHQLFIQMSDEHIESINKGGYTLIIDEEVAFVESYQGQYKREDILSLEKKGHIRIHEDDLGRVEWLWEDIEDNTVYEELKRLCDMHQLFCAKGNRKMLVTHLPIQLLTNTKENILLTYLFEGSLMHSFLKIKGIKISPLQEKYPEISLMKTEEEFKEGARKLITIGSTPSTMKAQKIGSLSSTWYSDGAKKEELDVVANAIRSILKKHLQSETLFTMPKDSSTRYLGDSRKLNPRCAINKHIKSGEGYFLHSSARATNIYSHKTVMIHAYNRFPHVSTKAYLQDYGDGIDPNTFALSEMIQWLWRSAIRNGQPVTFYFLSKRMEELFTKWLYE